MPRSSLLRAAAASDNLVARWAASQAAAASKLPIHSDISNPGRAGRSPRQSGAPHRQTSTVIGFVPAGSKLSVRSKRFQVTSRNQVEPQAGQA
jgi:hypothetical protein